VARYPYQEKTCPNRNQPHRAAAQRSMLRQSPLISPLLRKHRIVRHCPNLQANASNFPEPQNIMAYRQKPNGFRKITQAKKYRLKSDRERLPTCVRDPKPPHRDRAVAGPDRVDRHCNEAVARHASERRIGEAMHHPDRFGYSAVLRTGQYLTYVTPFAAKA
jgi:hypothetical protein